MGWRDETRAAVWTTPPLPPPRLDDAHACGDWFVAEAPARVDLAGGWTDTPPLAYQVGGIVVNVAIMVDGAVPIEARARRLPRSNAPSITLRVGGAENDCLASLTVTSLDDVRRACADPHAPAGLLLAALVCSGVVSVDDGARPLAEQLHWRGLEIHTHSRLPQGSGLGTSSILAGAVLAAVLGATGQPHVPPELLAYGVLRVEQQLSTCGGYQDAAGGLFPLLKCVTSPAALPLRVGVEMLSAPPGFIEALEAHMVLVYTGTSRLARDLLDQVVSRWLGRLSDCVATVDGLKETAAQCRAACLAGDIAETGRLLGCYWEQKKAMAGAGSAPPNVQRLMDALAPLVHGQALAGAGGGGFMVAITKQVHACEQLAAAASAVLTSEERAAVSFHRATIARAGLRTYWQACEA